MITTSTLFDQFARVDATPARYSEPSFVALNRSARPSMGKARELIETWYTAIPERIRAELRSRFRSTDQRQHLGAVFELFCHALLCGQQFTVDSPIVQGGKTAPDFVGTSSFGRFFLEATLVAKSDEEAKAQSRLDQLHDELNKIRSPNFFLNVNVSAPPSIVFATGRLRAFLENQLEQLDPDRVFAESGGSIDRLPSWTWQEQGCHLEFRAIPKKPEARGRPGARPIGMVTGNAEFVDCRKPVLKALKSKATKYGGFDCPYIIALNCLDLFIDDEDIFDALFGRGFVECDRSGAVVGSGRTPDGFWFGPTGRLNTRVSAVLIARWILPWHLVRTTPVLWHNPFASHPFPHHAWQGPQLIPNLETREMAHRPGMMTHEILGLEHDWPGIEQERQQRRHESSTN